MRSYFNGGGLGTPPPGPGLAGHRPMSGHRPVLMSGRASSSSLPRSPDNDTSLLTSGLGTGSGSGQSGHGSLGSQSHSSHEVSYMNIYQNTNHPHIYVSICISNWCTYVVQGFREIFITKVLYFIYIYKNIFCFRILTLKDLHDTPWVPTTVLTWAPLPVLLEMLGPHPTSHNQTINNTCLPWNLHEINTLWCHTQHLWNVKKKTWN